MGWVLVLRSANANEKIVRISMYIKVTKKRNDFVCNDLVVGTVELFERFFDAKLLTQHF